VRNFPVYSFWNLEQTQTGQNHRNFTSEPMFGGSERRMVASVALAKEDSLVNSSELRMAGQLFQGGEQKFVAK
jgi:hypothetical protein